MERIRTGKYKVSKIVKGSGRVWILSAMLWAMFCLTACSSRETVLLEEDDLVWTEEAQDRETGGEFRLEAAPSGTAGGPGSESAGAGTAQGMKLRAAGTARKTVWKVQGRRECPPCLYIFAARW